jgi:hypothetical protein
MRGFNSFKKYTVKFITCQQARERIACQMQKLAQQKKADYYQLSAITPAGAVVTHR